MRLIRSELLKIRTTNAWWLLAIGAVSATALAFLFNATGAHFELNQAVPTENEFPPGTPPEEIEQVRAEAQANEDRARSAAGLARMAANIYTSGQFFGLLLVLLLGVLIVTNEFFHQTATATFLTTPRRTSVIVGKLVTAMAFAANFWVLSTALSVGAGVIFFQSEGVDASLGEWPVTRSLLLNLAAYAMWAVLGVGLGTLIRSQIGAVVTGAVLYLLSFPIAFTVFGMINTYVIKEEWVLTAMVSVPAIASQIMISPEKVYPESPEQWVGAVVLIAYGVVAGVIGTLITRRRDIS